MPLQLITIKDLQDFKTELFAEIQRLLLLREEKSLEKKLLKTKDVCRILRLSPGTLQNLRKNHILYYEKVGGTLYYHYKDIEKILRNRDGKK
jgi:hypothetical protein